MYGPRHKPGWESRLAEIQVWIVSLRSLIAAIRVYNKRRERFMDLKRALKAESARIPGLDVETRWSSAYFMHEASLEAKSLLSAMRSESEDLEQYSVSKPFKEAIENKSGSNYGTLGMTMHTYQMLADAVYDFKQIESNFLQSIGTVMMQKLESYRALVLSDFSRAA